MSNFLPQLDTIGAFLLLALGFGFVIFVHELGHFLAAKFVGIKVQQFAIGFGPAAIAWRKGVGLRFGSTEKEFQAKIADALKRETAERSKQPIEDKDKDAASQTFSNKEFDDKVRQLGLGETEYRWNWIPLGGYVKMLGQEDANPAAQSDDPRSFGRKPVWARACVISAGVIMNLIFGIIFFDIAFMNGVKFNAPVVGGVHAGMPAAKSYAIGHDNEFEFKGLRRGDRIVSFDDEDVTDFGDAAVKIALSSPKEDHTIVVDREDNEGKTTQLSFIVRPTKDPSLKLLGIGMDRALSTEVAGMTDTLPDEYKKAGVATGMFITEVNGKPVRSFADVARYVESEQGESVPVVFSTKDKTKQATVSMKAEAELMVQDVPASDPDQLPTLNQHLFGLSPATRVMGVLKKSPAEAAGIKEGDVIARINTWMWPRNEDLPRAVKEAGGKEMELEVLRDGQIVVLSPLKADRKGLIGIGRAPATEATFVGHTIPGTPAASLKLNAGSKITSVNGMAVQSYSDINRAVTAAIKAQPPTTQPAALSVKVGYVLNVAGATEQEAVLTLDATSIKEFKQAGWKLSVPDNLLAFDMVLIKANDPVGTAAGIGIRKTGQFMVQTWLTVGRVMQGTVPLEQMSGPIGIADQGTRLTKQFGWPSLLWFLGLISANLAVINFLPIPVVDGGLMTMLIIEKLKGSPLNAKVQEVVTYVGLALLLSLVIYVSYHDVARFLGMS